MIETFKIIKQYYDPNVSPNFTLANNNLRGHEFKLYKLRANHIYRKNYFTFRIINTWNSLPADVVNAPSINAFKNRLDNLWLNHPAKYNFEAIWNEDIFES